MGHLSQCVGSVPVLGLDFVVEGSSSGSGCSGVGSRVKEAQVYGLECKKTENVRRLDLLAERPERKLSRAVNLHPSGWKRARARMCRLISLVGVK